MKWIKELLQNLRNFYFGFYDAANKFHYLFRKKMYLTAFLALLTLLLAIVGFLLEGNHLFLSISKALKFFTFGFPDEFHPYNIFILLATILATITVFLAAIFTFFHDFINRQVAKTILEKPHSVLFGLGEINRAFLNSVCEKSEKDMLIIEHDAKNVYIEDVRAKGLAVIVGDILTDSLFNMLNFKQTEHAIIALGNDQLNIEVAIKIINTIKNNNIKSPTRLIVHIADKRLNELFHQNFINPSLEDSVKIDIKTFSFYEECAKELFETHAIDGGSTHYIRDAKSFASVVCGEGELALHVIETMLLLSNFPYQNKHTLYLASAKADVLNEEVMCRLYYTPEKFPSVEIVPLKVEANTVAFYQQDIWKNEDLVNVIVCYDNEETNLKIAVALQQRIYMRNEHLTTKVFIGMFGEYSLSHLIDTDHHAFNRFFTFGSKKRVFAKENLLDEENYNIAKAIHYGYRDAFNKNRLESFQAFDEKWYKSTKYSDKLSNIAQAKHLNIKLKALGLTKQKSSLSTQALLRKNQTIFDEIIIPLMEESGLNYETLRDYSQELDKFYNNQPYKVSYTPQTYHTLFEKLIACEHERWNSYHYLNGWEYGLVKNKSIKTHDCLKPLEMFHEDHLKMTILYDIYSIVYIPNYLANAGWELIKI